LRGIDQGQPGLLVIAEQRVDLRLGDLSGVVLRIGLLPPVEGRCTSRRGGAGLLARHPDHDGTDHDHDHGCGDRGHGDDRPPETHDSDSHGRR
jgi:hypothetical protein